MKAVILAAGKGTRMGHLTKDRPKCMLAFLGKTLLEKQLEIMRACGIDNIIVVTGYMAESIPYHWCLKVKNERFDSTNMVESFFCSRPYWDDDIIVSYGDIIYEERVLRAIIGSSRDISVAVDINGVSYFKERFGVGFKSKMESLVMDGTKIKDIGEPDPNIEKIHGQYIGLIRFSRKGLRTISEIYDIDRKVYYDKPWMRSKNFQNGYMTDILQRAIDMGSSIESVKIKSGWLEFDTISDYEKYNSLNMEGRLARYYDPYK